MDTMLFSLKRNKVGDIMRDYKKALYFFSIILLSLVGLYSHNLEPKLKPEDNLPSYEIAFMMREGDLRGAA